jgi:multicomponent Na+:H+ antiporter subunit A
MMLLLVALHLLAAAVIPLAAGGSTRRAAVVAAVAPAATLGWLVVQSPGVLDGTPVLQAVSWVGPLDLGLDLRLDPAALLLGIVVSAIGLGIVAYSAGYFGTKPATPRFLAALVAFGGSMVGLAVADHLIALYLFWEGTTVTSYLLIGHDDRNASARDAARQAALVTVLGGLAMLGGIVLLGLDAGTFRLSELAADPPSGVTVAIALGLILVGALTKSAQFPFHDWLPGAMAAPTPASAYLHSATMVKAGVFLLLRLAPVAATVGYWTPVVGAIGTTTMLLGGWRALREHDLKLVLAYGTLSQLGLLTVLGAAATPAAVTAGFAMLTAHALFKAALFLVVGAVDVGQGTRDLRELRGLRHRHPVLAVTAVVAGLSMAGAPPLFGFVAKEAALDALLSTAPILAAAIGAGSVLTVLYTVRVVRPFFGAPGPTPTRDRPRGALIVVPAALAGLGLVLGIVPRLVAPLADAAGAAVHGIDGAVKLVLWPGLKPALAISAISLAIGAIVAAGPVDRWVARAPRLPSARAAFHAMLSGTLRLAHASTAVFQSGSLPVYLGVVLATVLVVPGIALGAALAVPDELLIAESWVQGLVVALMGVGSIALVVVRRRLAALLLLGSVGYGMAALFVLQGAPDLALTQLLIETVGLVVIALVLFRMPVRFAGSSWRLGRILRAVVALGVGVFVTAALLTAGAAAPDREISAYYEATSLPEAGGRNIVNVILTDFRALDTFGEITVLTTAALGVAALLIGSRSRREDR